MLAAGAWLLAGLVPLVLVFSTDFRDREVSQMADLKEVLIRVSGMPASKSIIDPPSDG